MSEELFYKLETEEDKRNYKILDSEVKDWLKQAKQNAKDLISYINNALKSKFVNKDHLDDIDSFPHDIDYAVGMARELCDALQTGEEVYAMRKEN